MGIAAIIGLSIWYFSNRSKESIQEKNPEQMDAQASEPTETKPQEIQFTSSKTDTSSGIGSPLINKNPIPQKSTAIPQSISAKQETDEMPQNFVVDRAGVLRDGQGSLLKTRHGAAVKACADHEMQLATIRELVNWGGKVFDPTKESENEIPPGYSKELVSAINPDGKKDEFYIVYNSKGGSFRPVGDLRDHFVWSSSINANNSSEYYALDATSGYVSVGESSDPDPKFHFGAVRCVPKPKPKTR